MEQVHRTSKVSVGQAVKVSGKSRSVIFRAIKRGQISATKNSKGHHQIDRSELTRWIDANRPEQVPEGIPFSHKILPSITRHELQA
jgi:hypothetical protein